MQLKEMFSNVNDWLKFAELKNGMMVALNSTFVLAVIKSEFKEKFQAGVYFVVLSLFVISLILSISSYLPKIKCIDDNWLIGKKKGIKPERNLLFYGDIYNISKNDLVNKVYKEYFKKDISNIEINKIELDYAEEIIVNSKIAIYKYFLFKLSLYITLFSLLVILISQAGYSFWLYGTL